MSRINTNVPSLVAQNFLSRSQGDLQTALNRLSSGLRINSGKDDPAGLIASEQLRSDIVAANSAIKNSEQANSVIATAESALGEINKILNDIRGLVTEAANTGALSTDQIAANQLQVDASLEAIDRIASTTSFQGKKLLDGSLNFITTGVAATTFSSLDITQATLPASGSLAVTLTLTTAATKATITGPSGTLAAQSVVEISGNKGAEVFTFGTGTTVAQIVSAVNLVADAIGVDAATVAGAATFTSQIFGSDQFVSVQLVAGAAFTGTGRNVGADAVGNINGTAFSAKGNNISINTSTLDLTANLVSTFAPGSSTFNITGGGALFQVGPDVYSTQQTRIGITSTNTAQLGGLNGRLYELRSGQANDLDSDATDAFEITDEVITKIASLRGRLGAFQRTTLESNISSLTDTVANLSDAESTIRDADFAAETARLTRAQILVQSGTAVLSIANSNPQNVLALLPR